MLTRSALTPGVEAFAGDLGRLVGLELAAEAGRRARKVVGPVRPIADPGRPIELDGPLDHVVAEGLGIDLAAVNDAAGRVGMTAALAATEVTLGRTDGAFDPAALDGLRARLDTELGRVAAAAMPTVKRAPVPKGGRRRRAPAPEPEVVPDALDDLLGRMASAAEEIRP